MSEQDLWILTPYEVDLLWQAYQDKRRREVLPLALLIQDFRNVHRDPQRQPVALTLEEVMTWLGCPFPVQEPLPPASPEALREKLRLAAQIFPRQNGQDREQGETG